MHFTKCPFGEGSQSSAVKDQTAGAGPHLAHHSELWRLNQFTAPYLCPPGHPELGLCLTHSSP